MNTDKKKFDGRPEESFALTQDLFDAFKESELFKHVNDNPKFVFDALVGVASFTAILLKALNECMSKDSDVINLYNSFILPMTCSMATKKDDVIELLNIIHSDISAS